MLASLNHQHIAQVYGVIDALAAPVMELVDGEDLSQRISRGAIPVRDSLEYSVVGYRLMSLLPGHAASIPHIGSLQGAPHQAARPRPLLNVFHFLPPRPAHPSQGDPSATALRGGHPSRHSPRPSSARPPSFTKASLGRGQPHQHGHSSRAPSPPTWRRKSRPRARWSTWVWTYGDSGALGFTFW